MNPRNWLSAGPIYPERRLARPGPGTLFASQVTNSKDPRNMKKSFTRRSNRSRLNVEMLEDRCLLSYSVIDLGTLGGANSFSQGMNDSGQVVGYSYTASGAAHAFAWDSIHGMQDLGIFQENFSEAHAINSSGQVVGRSTVTIDTLHTFHPFLWDSIHGMQDLDPSGFYSNAYDINDAGQVIGDNTNRRPHPTRFRVGQHPRHARPRHAGRDF